MYPYSASLLSATISITPSQRRFMFSRFLTIRQLQQSTVLQSHLVCGYDSVSAVGHLPSFLLLSLDPAEDALGMCRVRGQLARRPMICHGRTPGNRRRLIEVYRTRHDRRLMPGCVRRSNCIDPFPFLRAISEVMIVVVSAGLVFTTL
jgi:hypothetical protein